MKPRLTALDWVHVTHQPDGTVQFVYRGAGSAGTVFFFTVILVMWTAFLVAALFGWMGDVPAGWLIFASAGELVTVAWLSWMIFSRTRLVLSPKRLSIELSFWRWRWTSHLPRQAIRAVRQTQDGGTDGDTILRFGLRVEAEHPITVLAHQEDYMSSYLGPEIARWAGVAYIPASREVA